MIGGLAAPKPPVQELPEFLKRKTKICEEPKVKMRRLNICAITPQKIAEASVWGRMDAGTLARKDLFLKLEETFAMASIVKKSGENSGDPAKKLEITKKAKKPLIFDEKQSQNLGQ